jgi:hypothetical protein
MYNFIQIKANDKFVTQTKYMLIFLNPFVTHFIILLRHIILSRHVFHPMPLKSAGLSQ